MSPRPAPNPSDDHLAIGCRPCESSAVTSQLHQLVAAWSTASGLSWATTWGSLAHGAAALSGQHLLRLPVPVTVSLVGREQKRPTPQENLPQPVAAGSGGGPAALLLRRRRLRPPARGGVDARCQNVAAYAVEQFEHAMVEPDWALFDAHLIGDVNELAADLSIARQGAAA